MIHKGEIIALDQTELKGSTRPKLVTALVNGERNLYVLKVFKLEPKNEVNYLLSELVCNQLAKCFDLPVPEPCLLKLSSIIENEDSVKAIKERMEMSGDQYHFATKYDPDAAEYIDGFLSGQLEDWDAASVWAFDHFVFNVDRRLTKTNLLVRNNTPLLIDHDSALFAGRGIVEIIRQGNMTPFYVPRLNEEHIFHSFMTDKRKRADDCLDTFEMYFNAISITEIENILSEIENLDVKQIRLNLVLEYLRALLSNKSAFLKMLKNKAKL